MSRRLRDFLGNEAVALPEQWGSGTTVPCGFYGISQGAILGAGYSEFSTMVSELSTMSKVNYAIVFVTEVMLSCFHTPMHRRSMIFASICRLNVFEFKKRCGIYG